LGFTWDFGRDATDWDLTWDFGRDTTNKDLTCIITEMQPIGIRNGILTGMESLKI